MPFCGMAAVSRKIQAAMFRRRFFNKCRDLLTFSMVEPTGIEPVTS
jgi:hypothetical protein